MDTEGAASRAMGSISVFIRVHRWLKLDRKIGYSDGFVLQERADQRVEFL